MKQPDWTRPSNIKKVRKAIGFINIALNGMKPHPLPQKYLDHNLGRKNTAIGYWLRFYLLIEVNNGFYNPYEHECKQYIQNKRGIAKVKELIGETNAKATPYADAKEYINDRYKDELSSGEFEYETKSNRDWHDLQRIPSKKRSMLFAINGMPHEYDISAAAPTILYQLHKSVPLVKGPRGGYISGYDGRKLEVIEKYLEDKKTFRQFIANEIGIDYETAKTVINAMFNGARRTRESKLYEKIGRNNVILHRLQKYVLLNKLASEISHMWSVIAELHPNRYDNEGNKQRLSSSEKYDLYFEKELEIVNVVRQYCFNNKIRVFSIHDGYITSDQIDVNELQKEVKNKTGFDVIFEYEYAGDF